MWSLLSIVAAQPDVVNGSLAHGRLAERLAPEPADLVILYAGEHRSRQGDCGCPSAPRGSLGRLERYAEAVRRAGDPVLLVNPGGWLDDPIGDDNRLRADAPVAGRAMVEAIERGSWDALNVSFRELPVLDAIDGRPAGLVSANAVGLKGVSPYTVVDAGGRRVAITGLTRWAKVYLQPPGVKRRDPVEALQALLPSLRREADLVVVLAYGLGERAKEVAALDVDVLIDADAHRAWSAPSLWSGTVWAHSVDEGTIVGELRLHFDADGALTRVEGRGVELDAQIPWPHRWRRLHRRSVAARTAAMAR